MYIILQVLQVKLIRSTGLINITIFLVNYNVRKLNLLSVLRLIM